MARSIRRVISSRGWVKCECTEATHRSKPSRNSAGQSTSPSGPMFSSVPCSSRIPPYWPSRRRTSARWASIFSSVIRCMNRFGAWSVTA